MHHASHVHLIALVRGAGTVGSRGSNDHP